MADTMNKIINPGGGSNNIPSIMNSAFTFNLGLGSEKTWSDPSTGGGGPIPSFNAGTASTGLSSPGFGGSMMDAQTMSNNKPGRQKNPFVFQHDIEALSTDAQMRYAEGHLMFFKNTPDKSVKRYTAYALQNLNYFLELSHRNKLQQEQEKLIYSVNKSKSGGGGNGGGGNDKTMEAYNEQQTRKRSLFNDAVDLFPSNVDEFEDGMLFEGVWSTSTDKKGARQRNGGIIAEGEIKIGNIFGRLQPGDYVGLECKFVNNPYPNFMDDNGSVLGAATSGSIPQVVGIFETTGKFPAHCTNQNGRGPNNGSNYMRVGEPNDMDFISECEIKQYEYSEVDSDGFTNFNSRKQKVSTLKTDIYQQSFYIPLGYVKYGTSKPPAQDILMGLRSFDAYTKLLANHPVVIQMDLSIKNRLC